MANGTCFAVLLMGLNGKTYQVNVNGIETKNAIQAGKDAVAQLQQLAATNDAGDISPAGQGAPLLCGCARLWSGGWQVHYRALGSILAMVVTPDGLNAFAALNLLSSVVRIVCQDGKVVELTPERLLRKPSETYLAIDAVVGSAGALGASDALADARAAFDAPGGANTRRVSARTGAGSYSVSKRTLSSQVDQLGGLTFSSSAALFGLQARPAFALSGAWGESTGIKPKAPLPTTTLMASQDPFAQVPGSSGAPKPAAASSDPFEDIFGPITNAAMLGNADQAAAAADKVKVAADKVKAAEAAEKAAAAAALVAAMAESAAPPVVEQLPARPLLRLVETWRGDAVGGAFARAGVDGAVVWAHGAADEPPLPVPFALTCADWAQGNGVPAALASASRHAMATSVGTDLQGRIVADPDSAQMSAPPALLRYHVPPGPGTSPPLTVRVDASTMAAKDGETVVVVGVRVAVASREGMALEGMDVSLALPALFAMPLRVAPAGATLDAASARLQWSVPAERLKPGCQEVLTAVFKVAADEAACVEAARASLAAHVELRSGASASGFSGVTLVQAAADGDHEPTATWRAVVHAVPAR
ncbi:hypothetical protein FOA52_015218 [Chlamydomonas sp. UWO 241]|nr:hypothetical protein FOA52_015218 [Chlamydomonas sp. UWO 241]